MLSFLSTAKKSQIQTGYNNFKEKELTNIMCCSSSESVDKTIRSGWIDHSIHGCNHVCMVNVKAVFLMKCYSPWSWLHQMHFQWKVERCLNNKTLQQRECSEFQTNETAENKTSQLTLLWYFMYVKEKISTEVTSWKYHINFVDSSPALFHYERKHDLEPKLQENASWGQNYVFSLKLNLRKM